MSNFDPDWVVKPGDTLLEHLIDGFVDESGLTTEEVQGVLDGEPITLDIATGLFRGTGVSVQFWLNMEDSFRRGLAAGKTVL